ncbi:hypothetical protein IFM89_008827 [Coptis chinensis]|uniref:SAWADEE domain-containing protein n=1 Tax=Coptis chinensis TaxID=261450 RepID=A0A835HBK1_9MAGN|nr:hypothetical protein IFM89_008827 [Coptis chinensis]
MSTVSSEADDGVELEAMRKEDSSWHPCRVSLSSDTSTNFGLLVDFGGQVCEEVIFTEEEAQGRIRLRSTPLQGDECLHIKVGEHVLASQETQFGILFYDAKVEKVHRVRHSKRNQCRCTFEIKWLYLHLKEGTATVPASSVMRLATNAVDSHPIVSEFLKSVKTVNALGVSAFVSLLEDTVSKTDPLEKQIEKITKSADMSRIGCSEAYPLELKEVDLTGQVGHRKIATEMSFLHGQAPHGQNNSRRTTRSQRKVQLETKNIPPPQSVNEELGRPHLSPLGARAALASLLQREGFTSAFQSTPVKHATIMSLDVTSLSGQEKASMKDGLTLSLEACMAPVILTNAEVLTSDRRDASNNCLQNAVMQNRLEEPASIANHTVKRSLACSLSEIELKTPLKTTRLARSAIQKGIELSNDKVDLKSSSTEMKLCSPTHTPRVTRSTIQRETREGTVEVSNRLQESKSAQDPGSDSSLSRKEIEHSKDKIEKKSSAEVMKVQGPAYTSRLTRSATQKEARSVIIEVNKGLEERTLAEDTSTVSTRENHVMLQTKEPRRKRPLSSASDDDVNISLAQESKKKQRMSNDTRIPKSEGEMSEADGCSQSEKKSVLSKTKPKMRFSPRLRFLPRTRSQK